MVLVICFIMGVFPDQPPGLSYTTSLIGCVLHAREIFVESVVYRTVHSLLPPAPCQCENDINAYQKRKNNEEKEKEKETND